MGFLTNEEYRELELFYDERDGRPLATTCGDSPEFRRCDIEGHEDIGYCNAYNEFCRASDPDECD